MNKKQKLLLEYLISSGDTFAKCSPIIRPEFFDPELRNTVTFIQKYYDDHNTTPKPDQILAETDVQLERKNIDRDQIEYCSTEIERFCKRKAMEAAVLSMPDCITEENYGAAETLLKDALLISLNRDLGLRYFDDPEERMRRILETQSPQSVGWKEFDDALHGGILRQQMLLLSANSGGGKSIAMSNIALNLMEAGLNVLYFSLELSEDMISQRFDSMVTGVHTAEWRHKITETANKIEQRKSKLGQLFIKYMPSGTNSNQLRAYLKEFQLQNNMIPDVIVVDYLDIMGTNDYISADNVFEKDKMVSEQLRNIAAEYNAFMITASQQNRGAVGQTDLNHSHIAGGISKINTTDVYVSIIMTEKMRAGGEIAFQFLKTRSSDGVGKTIYLQWDGKTLRIKDFPDGKGRLSMIPRSTTESVEGGKNTKVDKASDETFSGNGLLDLLDKNTKFKDLPE